MTIRRCTSIMKMTQMILLFNHIHPHSLIVILRRFRWQMLKSIIFFLIFQIDGRLILSRWLGKWTFFSCSWILLCMILIIWSISCRFLLFNEGFKLLFHIIFERLTIPFIWIFLIFKFIVCSLINTVESIPS